jgi:hypothetical protein
VTIALLTGLIVMALIDATSFGTLGVPVWMLVQPRIRVAAVLAYLGVIAAFYWVLGIGLLGGAGILVDAVHRVQDGRPVLWAQLAVGVGLLLVSFLFGGKPAARRSARRAVRGVPSRHERWRQRVVGDAATTRAVAVVALLAGLVEAASMLPYLAAIGMLTASGLVLPAQIGVLAGYVVVMTLPALVLLGGRLLASGALTPWLERINQWMQRNGGEILGWVVGIVGFLLAADAAQSLRVWPY